VDLARIASEVSEAVGRMESSRTEIVRANGHADALTVAIMGCAVNGPGEASHADLGVACGEGRAVLFKNGTIMTSMDEKEIVPTILKEISAFECDNRK
jgi:(E)-4-hydroxy-3-methylbut-2-enyl-diphosphate synthase